MLDSFVKRFSCNEVKEVTVLLEDGPFVLHIRRLPYMDCARFRKSAQSAVQRAAFDAIVCKEKLSFAVYDDDVELAEFYLLKRSICNQDGSLIFNDKDDDVFDDWLNQMKNDIAQTILREIAIFNNLIESEEDETSEDIKKK